MENIEIELATIILKRYLLIKLAGVIKMENIFAKKATREIHHHSPTKVGLDLISLDNNYTNEYNCNNDESSGFHLCSFRGIDYLPRGCRLVAKTPQNYTKKLSKFFITLIFSTQLVASGIPTVDAAAIARQLISYQQQIKDYAMQLQQYQQLYSQLQQQIQMVKMQTQNLKTLSSYDWQNLNILLYKAKNVMQRVDAVSYDLGNVSRKFEEIYRDYGGYFDDINSASDENARNKIFTDKHKQINETNQNTLNGTLQKLELANKEFPNEDRTIASLKERSQNAEGNLQAIQATNDLLTYQIDEARKLRVSIMDQTNALTNYMASQNNEKILDDVKYEKMSKRTIKRF
ncbi:P-type conjugative transfer protein TrbJ [Campylobacter fetus]|uniref:P-type conjugative transfer protein TrbJ n=1 Tax=Campylobacter fetus TaxID=196 RepID=UPI001F1EB5EF|nr:P-type conjugative transfer protein TrbJ [Campylobacter fetus]